jgi:hypothetical protein
MHNHGPLWELAASPRSHLYNLFRDCLDDDERDGDPMRFISATRLAASIALSATVLSATVLSATSAWGQEKKSSPELTVAAAADLSSALQEIADRYEKKPACT